MKIGVFFDAKPTSGGGFYLQLQPCLTINEIKKYKTKIEFIVLYFLISLIVKQGCSCK